MPDLVFLGCDKESLVLKQIIEADLHKKNVKFFDYLNDDFTDDFVQKAHILHDLCSKILDTPNSLGILISESGVDMSMFANKYEKIRAALCTTELHAKLSRQHNNANILCLGSKVTGIELAKAITWTFLTSQFEGGRHLRRINNIDNHQEILYKYNQI